MQTEKCPYHSYPRSRFWSDGINPKFIGKPFLDKSSIIASYGSCFASKVSRNLRERKFNYIYLENRSEVMNGGDEFSSASGNIYSPHQLLSKLLLANKAIDPPTPLIGEDGLWSNPLRPLVKKYNSSKEAIVDEISHSKFFKQSISEASHVIFTMGLNEVWINIRENITYAIAPGCGWGKFDASRDMPHIPSPAELDNALLEVEKETRKINSKIRIIWTVSPVPLMATFTDHNSIEANFFSKSTLLSTIRSFCDSKEKIDNYSSYFPAYEIINNPFHIKENFQQDMRTISILGEKRVMRVFFGDETADPSDLAESAHHDAAAIRNPSDDKLGGDPCDEEFYNSKLRLKEYE
jgi:hypothetical protein